jgi:pilus assembly protein Flp/PilA
MVKLVTSFIRDDSGASAAEYALILAIVGSAIAVAAIALGGSISNALNRTATKINAINT